MEPNLGPIHRSIRIAIGIVLLGVGLLAARGVLRVVLGLVGAVLVFSGSAGFCHVRKFLGELGDGRRS